MKDPSPTRLHPQSWTFGISTTSCASSTSGPIQAEAGSVILTPRSIQNAAMRSRIRAEAWASSACVLTPIISSSGIG